MPIFSYLVKDKVGRTHTGLLESESRHRLIEHLWKQEFVVLSISERSDQGGAVLKVGQPRVKAQLVVVFSRQLATMVDSGMSITASLDVLAEQMDARHFREIIRRMQGDIEAGSSLGDAFARHPRVFSEFYINMVRAGESSGRLHEILDRMAGYLEKASHLQRKVQASLFYPGFVSFLAFAITMFLLIVIVPKFKEIFTALGGKLPAPTQVLLDVSQFLGTYLVYEILIGAGLIGALQSYRRTPQGRRLFDRLALRVPIVGKLLQQVFIARVARTLSTLIKSGVPILTSLEIVAKTAGNKIVEAAILATRSSVKDGESIAGPLGQSPVFPPMVTRMIAVGEKTGELEKMLTKIAEFYEAEVDAAITAMTSLLEPLIIAVLGIVIGGIVIALFLPIFKISTLVSR